MPLSKLLKSAVPTCPFCRQKVSILSRRHPECRRTFQAGWDEMVRLAGGAMHSLERASGCPLGRLAKSRDSASTTATCLRGGCGPGVKR